MNFLSFTISKKNKHEQRPRQRIKKYSIRNTNRESGRIVTDFCYALNILILVFIEIVVDLSLHFILTLNIVP